MQIRGKISTRAKIGVFRQISRQRPIPNGSGLGMGGRSGAGEMRWPLDSGFGTERAHRVATLHVADRIT